MDIHYILSPVLLVSLLTTIIINGYKNPDEEFCMLVLSSVFSCFSIFVLVLILIYIRLVYNIDLTLNEDYQGRLLILFAQYLFTFIHTLYILRECLDVA